MRDNQFQTLELNQASPEKVPNPNQVFIDIIKTQESIENFRVNYFVNPKNTTNLFKALNIFKSPTFLEQQRPPRDIDDLVDLEAELGGELFSNSLPDVSDKKFFYSKDSWYLHVGDKNYSETTRFTVRENNATKVTENGLKEAGMSPEEISNLSKAVKLYQQKITEEIYASS